MLIHCATPRAHLLLAVPDAAAVLRFPGGHAPTPGIEVAVQALTPIGPQLVDAAVAALGAGIPALGVLVEQEFADALATASGAATLYVATLRLGSAFVAPNHWPTMPEILRRLKGRERIPFMRAWQVLAGGLHLNTKAVDAAEVARYFDDGPGDPQ